MTSILNGNRNSKISNKGWSELNRVYLHKDIIRELAKRSGYSQSVCEEVFNAYHDLLVDVICQRDRLQDYGYLDIYTKKVPKRVRSDPRDNSRKVELPEGYKLVFKAGKSLKDILDIIDEVNTTA